MERKRVLDSRMAWRIGNGESVDAISDNWITSSSYMKPTGCTNLQVGCKVSFFLAADGGWDVEKLRHYFSSDDVNNVLKIPISRNLPPDNLFWVHNKKGYYSVKSGYYQACKIINRNSASSSSSSPDNGLWSRIWRISVQPKVRHFLWRILHESLPCNVKLAQRLPAFSKLCPRCGSEEETQLHALKNCEVMRGLWLTSPLNLHVDRVQCNNMSEWLSQMFTMLKDVDLKVFVMSLWTIWTDRNNLVFGNS